MLTAIKEQMYISLRELILSRPGLFQRLLCDERIKKMITSDERLIRSLTLDKNFVNIMVKHNEESDNYSLNDKETQEKTKT